MRFNSIEMVFFDAGETLVHPTPSFAELFSSSCAEYGLEVDPVLLARMGRSLMAEVEEKQRQGFTFTNDINSSRRFWLDFYSSLVTAMGYDGQDDELPEVLYDIFSQRSNYGPYDDAFQALRELRDRGMRLGLVSNFEAWLEDLLEDLGLRGFFDVAIISGKEDFEKPHPRIFELALERTGMEPSQSMHVGDSPISDFAGALDVGMRPVLLDRWGRFPDFDGERVTSLIEIPGLLAPEF